MFEISSDEIIMTSKFVMSLNGLDKDESFTIRSFYSSSEDLSIEEIEDIAKIWDHTDRQEIINRFKYNEELTTGFGVIKLDSRKNELTTFNESGSEVSKSFESIITVTAVDDIPAGSILKL